MARLVENKADALGMVAAEFANGVEPVLTLTSRVSTGLTHEGWTPIRMAVLISSRSPVWLTLARAGDGSWENLKQLRKAKKSSCSIWE
jgi:hypothetical protein